MGRCEGRIRVGIEGCRYLKLVVAIDFVRRSAGTLREKVLV